MLELNNYDIHEKLIETNEKVYYTGIRHDTSEKVLIKLIKIKKASQATRAKFKHEINLIRGQSIDGLLNVIDSIEHKGNIVIIQEIFNGETLTDILKKGPFDIKSFLDSAIQITEILGRLHEKNLIHRAVNPNNILIDPSTNKVKFRDFGIEMILTKEYHNIYEPGVIKSILPYSSPELTGRMSRSFDYRADLYSLGILFYEMLTGQVPFFSSDPLEIIHSHLAARPVAPSNINRKIPSVVSNIIMKLIEKNPEERYQNAFGLLSDLEQCRNQLTLTGDIENFEIAGHDISSRFNIPQKLYGRVQELDIMLSCFEKACQGSTQILLVTGGPGIGKSALVNAMNKPAVAKRGYFISGKYEVLRRDVPYSSIIQAFQMLVRQLLTENEERIARWKQKIKNALGPNGKVLTDVLPEVKHIIGEQPEVDKLEIESAKNRFNIVFINFISVFLNEDHPLVLALDDLQWADEASLQIIQSLLTSDDIKHLFFIGSYREDDLYSGHHLLEVIKSIKSHTTVTSINLKPLGLYDIRDLISDCLKGSRDTNLKLSEIIYKKTGGNPFFVNQFLLNLYDEKYILHDNKANWKWDERQINKMQVTDNLVDMLVKKINRLKPDTQDLLKKCSCIGNRIDLETIAKIQNMSVDATLSAFNEAINEGLIHSFDNMLYFQHDRIQEAAYSLLSPEEKSRIHYAIGKQALEERPENIIGKYIFYIVDQLNAGINSIKDTDEKIRLYHLNRMAGDKAKATAAYNPALTYFAQAVSLLDENSWETQFDETFDLYSQIIESKYLLGDYPAVHKQIQSVLQYIPSPVDQARLLAIEVKACTGQRNFDQAVTVGLNALQKLGVDVIKNPDRDTVAAEFIKVSSALQNKTDEDILNIPDMEDINYLSAVNILKDLVIPTYYSNSMLSTLLILIQLNLHLHYGSHPVMALALVNYGIVIIVELKDIELAYRFGNMAFKILDKYHNKAMRPNILNNFNMFIRFWKEDAAISAASGMESYKTALETGNLEAAALGLFLNDTYLLATGRGIPDLEYTMARHNAIIGKLNQAHIQKSHSIWWQLVLNLRGKSSDPLLLIGEAFNELREEEKLISEKNYTTLNNLYYIKFLLHFFMEDFQKAYEFLEKAEMYKDHVRGLINYTNLTFYGSMARLALWPDVSGETQDQFLQFIIENQKNLKTWSEISPNNFLNKYYIIEAMLSQVKGDVFKTMDLFDAAIELSLRGGFQYEAGFANMLAGRFYYSLGKNKFADMYIQATYDIHLEHGSIALVHYYEKAYPQIVKTEINNHISTLASPTSSIIDISTVIKASQALSEEIVLNNLFSKIMRITMENAGAEKGIMILKDDNMLTVVAEASSDKKEITVLQPIILEKHQSVSSAIVNYVARTQKTLILNNASEEGDFRDDPYVKKNKLKSVLCMAILRQGRLTGILYLENNLSIGAFTPERIEILGIVSSQLAISIENARLYENLEEKVKERTQELEETYKKIEELANTDPLTGLSNRRDMIKKIESEKQRIERNKKPMAFIITDIDNFKQVNDTYGHDYGDLVLVTIAALMKSMIREQDKLARWGGEEFLFMLPETDLKGAMTLAEKIRKAIEKKSLTYQDTTLSLTMTFGISILDDPSIKINESLKKADRALYQGKRSGKNRVISLI